MVDVFSAQDDCAHIGGWTCTPPHQGPMDWEQGAGGSCLKSNDAQGGGECAIGMASELGGFAGGRTSWL